MELPRLNVKTHSQVFHPTPPLPEKEAQKNKGDTLGLRTQQSGRRGLSAIPSKAQAFHQAAALYKTF